MEYCQEWKEVATLQIDFALSCFFIVYFFIRCDQTPVDIAQQVWMYSYVMIYFSGSLRRMTR